MNGWSRAQSPWQYPSITVVSMIVILIVAACGPAPSESSPASAELGSEGEIVIAQGVDATTLDPNMHAETPTSNVNVQIYDSLLMRDAEGELQLSLAESYENIDDHTWEFRLRRGVTFHNGERFDAKSVKFTLDRILDPDNQSPQYSHISAISEVEIVDDYTIRMHTRDPFPTLPSQMVARQMVPAGYTGEHGGEHLARNPIGTGPYRFVSWTPDEEIRLRANEEYWRGMPTIRDVVFRVVPETSTRIAELQTGSVDIIVNVPPHQAETLEAGEGTAISRAPSSRAIFVGMVTTEPGPLTDRRVRQALNYGVDVDSIIENVLMGNGVPLAGQPVVDMHHGFSGSLDPYPHDPSRARELLADAGHPGGFSIAMDSPSGRYLMDRETAQAVAGQLEAIDVEVALNVQEWGVYVDKIMSRQLTELFLIGWGNATFDADATMYPWFRSGQQFCYFEDDALDAALDLARETMDMDVRQDRYIEIMQLLHEEAPWIFLHQQMDIYGISDRIEWNARPDELIHAYEARLRADD